MIKRYQDQMGNENWVVYVNVRSQKTSFRIQKKQKGFQSEAQAQKAEVKLIRECERELLLKEGQGLCWADLLEKYEAHIKADFSNKLSSITRIDYIATVRKHTQCWMKSDAANISSLDVKEIFNKSSKNISRAHQVKLKMILSNIFRFGIDSGLLKGMTVVPTNAVQFEKIEEKVPEILTLPEIKRLLFSAREMDHRWYPVWAAALLTGMRNGELFALTWSDIDFENKIINLSKSYNKRTRTTKCTKSGYWRHIPISSELEALLRSLRLKSNGSTHVLPRIRDWNKGYQAKELRAFCQSIGIPSIRFHALRACFATQLIRQGIPAIQIQKICGWKDLETMQRYIRLAGIEIAGATESLKIMPDAGVMGEVVNLFTRDKT